MAACCVKRSPELLACCHFMVDIQQRSPTTRKTKSLPLVIILSSAGFSISSVNYCAQANQMIHYPYRPLAPYINSRNAFKMRRIRPEVLVTKTMLKNCPKCRIHSIAVSRGQPCEWCRRKRMTRIKNVISLLIVGLAILLPALIVFITEVL